MRFVDRFRVILLDMMGTFMFDGDRFSANEDYARTYRRLGGHRLADIEVQSVIREVFDRMLRDYQDPARRENFASVGHYLEALLSEANLPCGEVGLLDRVFTMHEAGVIPETHAETIRRLHETHRLGVVSNVWGRSDLCLEEFRRAGVAGLFEATVFSSDYGINKPSPLLYRKAIDHFGVDISSVVFVGDDPVYDIAGAKAVGLATVWINAGGAPDEAACADLVVEDLRSLLEA